MVNEFLSAMQDAGIICKEQIIADGVIHRFANNGIGNKDAWYVFYGMAGAFGDWCQGTKEKWSIGSQNLSYQQKIDLKQQIDKAKKASDEERDRRYEETSREAPREWETLAESGHSSYLDRKGVSPIGIRFGRGGFAIPIKDVEGKLWSLQKIYDNGGTKRFLTGGRKKGCFHHLGTLKDRGPIYIVEGYATGASVYMATNQATVITFDAGNLDPVTEELRKIYPNSSITIAADND